MAIKSADSSFTRYQKKKGNNKQLTNFPELFQRRGNYDGHFFSFIFFYFFFFWHWRAKVAQSECLSCWCCFCHLQRATATVATSRQKKKIIDKKIIKSGYNFSHKHLLKNYEKILKRNLYYFWVINIKEIVETFFFVCFWNCFLWQVGL